MSSSDICILLQACDTHDCSYIKIYVNSVSKIKQSQSCKTTRNQMVYIKHKVCEEIYT